MQLLLLRFLTRLMAILAIVGGFLLGVSSITPGEGTYAVLLILVGIVVGWRGALWATTREAKANGKADEQPPGWPLPKAEVEAKRRRKERARGGKHRK